MGFFGSAPGPYELTPHGKQEAEGMDSVGPKYDVLTALLDRGALNVRTIVEETHRDRKQVETVIKQLEREGMIEQRRH